MEYANNKLSTLPTQVTAPDNLNIVLFRLVRWRMKEICELCINPSLPDKANILTIPRFELYENNPEQQLYEI